ncbi:NADH-quinone oxidoreductase subunit M [Lolliginicoccus levis]|uniref:NADH-quinone oxidoreductase subunit M n=1 Tax=Lolliginicoccus levis TaxID=2919542 RepID=UPI00241F4E36|nr:NADH-quinone oxidoreductase subunit M [Lolliginicoccus levis]
MSAIPWLSLLWLAPALGAVLLVLGRGWGARTITAIATLAPLGIVAVIATGFDATSPGAGGDRYQFIESQPWIPALGARYTLGLDGIGLALIALTAALTPLLVLAARHSRGAIALLLTTEAMALAAFTALDVLLFYVLFEAMLIPLYFLLAQRGRATARDDERAARTTAAGRFLLYNLFGGLVMLAAVIGLYAAAARQGLPTFDLRTLASAVETGNLELDPALANLLFLGFFLAFAIKAPLWPFHTWLPDAAKHATPTAAIMMMAIVDKVGTFAMLRYCLTLFPDASATFAPVIIGLAVTSILYGAILALAQTDLIRLIAYASISHFGFIILGIFAMTSQSQAGATLYMVNHGLATAALMLAAGYLIHRRGSRAIADYGGVQKVAPLLAGSFLIAGLATLSLPGLAPFVSEFLVLIGTYGPYPVAAILASGALVLAALYVLWTYQRIMTGPITSHTATLPDLRRREAAAIAPLLAALIVLGAYPAPLLDAITPAVAHTTSAPTGLEAGGER